MEKKKIKWLTIPEAAEHSRLTIQAIRYSIYDGTLPSYKPRKIRLVREDELDEYLLKSRTGATR